MYPRPQRRHCKPSRSHFIGLPAAACLWTCLGLLACSNSPTTGAAPRGESSPAPGLAATAREAGPAAQVLTPAIPGLEPATPGLVEADPGRAPAIPGLAPTAPGLASLAQDLAPTDPGRAPAAPVPDLPPPPAADTGSGGRPPDVVLVTIDALRADHLPMYGYARDTAPALAALAQEGVVFSHAFACSSETRASVPALLTGRFPPGPVWEEVPASLGLAERLKSAGYRTGAFLGNAWLAPERGYGRGFDRFLLLDYVYPPTDGGSSAPTPAAGKAAPRRIDGQELVRAAVSYLEASSRPTFVWLHLMDVHNPYRAPPPAQGLWAHPPGVDRYNNGPMPMALQPEDLTWMRDRYDEGIRHTDTLLQPLWKSLRQEARARRTLLIVTADHGEEFGEHGGLGHGTSLYYELLHVPLIMRLPDGAGRGARVDRPVALWDIVPTVLGSIGKAPDGLDGRDLRGLITAADSPASRAVLPDDRLLLNGVRSLLDNRLLLGAIQGPHHLLLSPEKNSRQLFRWLEDPSERQDLAGKRPPAGTMDSVPLERAVKTWFDARGSGQPPTPLVTGRQERLEALGYVGRP